MFEHEIEIPVPDEKKRLEILRKMTCGMSLDETVSLPQIALDTQGFVGADLLRVCKEATLHSLTDEETRPIVKRESFDHALGFVNPSCLSKYKSTIPNVSWDDIGGLEKCKEELIQLVQHPILYPDLYKQYGLPSSRGALLWGPPGCGKTLVAKALATECSANFITVNVCVIRVPGRIETGKKLCRVPKCCQNGLEKVSKTCGASLQKHVQVPLALYFLMRSILLERLVEVLVVNISTLFSIKF